MRLPRVAYRTRTGQTSVLNAAEDKVNDCRATYSLASGTNQDTAVLAFGSQRTNAPSPGNTVRADGTIDPNPIIVNPDGGTGGKSDIWTTSTGDFTPPILIPQGSGNQLYPVVAPGPQAPFTAPRTEETGLQPNSPIRVAMVLQDKESGVSGVTVIVRKADVYGFGDPRQFPVTPVNETIPVQISPELGH